MLVCLCTHKMTDGRTRNWRLEYGWRTEKELSYEIIMYSEFQRKCSESIGECCASAARYTNVNLNKYAFVCERDYGCDCRRTTYDVG